MLYLNLLAFGGPYNSTSLTEDRELDGLDETAILHLQSEQQLDGENLILKIFTCVGEFFTRSQERLISSKVEDCSLYMYKQSYTRIHVYSWR